MTKAEQAELAEILAAIAKELGLSRRKLFSKIHEKVGDDLRPGNN